MSNKNQVNKPGDAYLLNVITVKHATPDESCNEESPSAVQTVIDDEAHSMFVSGLEQLKLEDQHPDKDAPEIPSKRGVTFTDAFTAAEDGPVKEGGSCAMFNIEGSSFNVPSKSKSERDGERHRKSESRLFPKKLGLRVSQMRTITPSARRSRNSTLLVQPGKGRASLHHRITIEALSRNGIHCDDDGCKNINDEDDGDDCGDDSGKENEVRHLNIQLRSKPGVRADSVKFQRRGRSLFRTTMHKRSRARSPGDRHGEDTGKVHGIRRESPSPRSGQRKRNWVRKVMTRAEREKKLKEKDEAEPKQ